MIVTHALAKINVKGYLVQTTDWKQTDGRTRPIALLYAADNKNITGYLWSSF